jgi:hypothetical protein
MEATASSSDALRIYLVHPSRTVAILLALVWWKLGVIGELCVAERWMGSTCSNWVLIAVNWNHGPDTPRAVLSSTTRNEVMFGLRCQFDDISASLGVLPAGKSRFSNSTFTNRCLGV